MYFSFECIPTNTEKKNTVQEKRLKNEGKTHLLLLYKQAHDKKGIEESMHVYINRARLTAWEVGIFSREISRRYAHPLL